MKKRPNTICLMMTTLDGKILGDKWGDHPQMDKLRGKFEEVHNIIGNNAWIVGRTTMEKDFTNFASPVYKPGTHHLDRTDFVANPDAGSFAIAVDAHGKLGWEKPEMHGDHVITVLTEGVSDAYLAHLQDIGVSYIFGGIAEIDLHVVLEKLFTLFNIKILMVEGGGHLNGSFLNEGLIDEYHHLLLPVVDGNPEHPAMFEIDPAAKKFDAALLKLEEVKRIEDDVLWLTYKL
ncbi:RibD family protein [Chitinophaga silvisoli]|uniref:Deaminase n=1 Tax=Chitinophaga silvisoli TaxID=2291814 RepID=A0A3E1NV86_9BACT|nr:RibD family protein [Chitinophaga silvisoli]RFM31817.1 deaminase [Chitinophaga silvisoli]